MKTNNKHLESFEKFMDERLKASTDFVEGKFKPLKQISVTQSPATILDQKGNCVQGVENVNAVNEKGASMFEPGAKKLLLK